MHCLKHRLLSWGKVRSPVVQRARAYKCSARCAASQSLLNRCFFCHTSLYGVVPRQCPAYFMYSSCTMFVDRLGGTTAPPAPTRTSTATSRSLWRTPPLTPTATCTTSRCCGWPRRPRCQPSPSPTVSHAHLSCRALDRQCAAAHGDGVHAAHCHAGQQ